MTARAPSVWDNVPARLAQADGGSVLDSVTSALGKQAEQGVRGAVKEYLDTKGDKRVADLVGTIKLALALTTTVVALYYFKKSGD